MANGDAVANVQMGTLVKRVQMGCKKILLLSYQRPHSLIPAHWDCWELSPFWLNLGKVVNMNLMIPV